MYLIAGLGNPGPEYEGSRHNVGFRVIELWSKMLNVRLGSRGFQSRNARVPYHQTDLVLLCPMTFMNLSGKSVRSSAEFYEVNTRNILVVHDDLDLPVGRIKVTPNGGAGGHKGVMSIISHLGDPGFARVKVGIGRPRYGEGVEDFVLSPFYEDERDVMERVIHLAVRACELFVSGGLETAMNHINGRNVGEESDLPEQDQGAWK